MKVITRIYWITPIIELQGSKILISGFRASPPEQLGSCDKNQSPTQKIVIKI